MNRVERMFGPREEWGKAGEMDRVRERAGRMPEKGERRSDKPAAGRADGTPRKAAEPVAGGGRGAREAKKAGFNLGSHPGISGFVSIRCGGCGKVIDTCLRERQRVFRCRGCGHETGLERVANIHMKCARCGFTGKYRTNRVEKELNMECLGCSAIVPMKRLRRGNYVPQTEVEV